MTATHHGNRGNILHSDPVEFSTLYHRLKAACDWGPSDRRGALNNIALAEVLAAGREIRKGRFVSLSAPIEPEVSTDNPDPLRHEMINPTDGHLGSTGLEFAFDRVSFNVHGNADSHIDALSHVVYEGKFTTDLVLTRSGRLDRQRCRSR